MSDWEEKCTRCTLCCYSKLPLYDTLVIFMDQPCEYLDEENKRCTIYSDRLKLNKKCLKVNRMRAIFSSSLPDTCGYVLWAKQNHIRFPRARIVELRKLDE